MAKLTISLDTETQELTCDVDGTAVSNINDVSLSNYNYGESDPQYHFYVTTYEKIDGLHKMTRLYAADSPDGRNAMKSGGAVASKKFPGFVEVPTKTKAQEQIAEILRANSKR
jgi:hypothetical protein